MVQANSATSEEAAASSQQLNNQASRMKASVARFKLNHVGGSFYRRMPDILKYRSRGLTAAPLIQPAEAGVKPKKIALTDDEGFGKY